MSGGAGLVLRVRGERRFLPALLVESIVPTPRLSAFPGSALRLALIGGRVVPVLELGEQQSQLVLSRVDGEALALSGVEVEESGFFQAEGDGVRLGDELIAPFDLAAELARVAPARSGAGS